MDEKETKIIEIPEITRVEGHSAVTVELVEGKVKEVHLEVFEGTRFFEQIVLGHKYDEIPHITSRVCAICSTGHVVAAAHAIENIFAISPSDKTKELRHLMHLGMIIESHATHICALALPDFLNTRDITEFATRYPNEFALWTTLRKLGASIQTVIGGRPFHPVNLHVGGLSRHPNKDELQGLLMILLCSREAAIKLCQLVMSFEAPVKKTAPPRYLALIPDGTAYSYFGNTVQCSDGWQEPIENYKQYLDERVVNYSHAKRSLVKGKPVLVGALARLHFSHERLSAEASALYKQSPLAQGESNTFLNNLAQAIELVDAIDQAKNTIDKLLADSGQESLPDISSFIKAGAAVGAVECPRGTLYHYYQVDSQGKILAADMITPSAQNSARIEQDICTVANEYLKTKTDVNHSDNTDGLQAALETLVRAFDPCNTCATHMVSVKSLTT